MLNIDALEIAAMVIVASVALSIMVSNDIVIPVVLRRNLIGGVEQQDDLSRMLLRIRRLAIFFVLLLGYAYYRAATANAGLASMGLLAFAAAQVTVDTITGRQRYTARYLAREKMPVGPAS